MAGAINPWSRMMNKIKSICVSFIIIIKNKLEKMYDTGAITAGTFATKFVAFFGSIVVVRLLDKSDYGVMCYVENIYSYAFIFAGLGLSNGILRYLVIAEDDKEKKSYYDYIIKRSILIDLTIAVIIFSIAIIIEIPGNYSEARFLIPVIAILLPFQDLLNEVLYTIRSFFKNKIYAYLAFGSSSILIIGRIVGAVLCGVSGVLWSRVIINAIFALLIFAYVGKRFFSDYQSVPLSDDKRKTVNAYSFQYMITNGFWAIFMLNDTFLLGIMLNDPSILADYKVAYVLPGNISIFATAIGVFAGPYFTKNENNLKWIREKYKKVFLISSVIVGGVAITIGFFAGPLIKLMYGEQYLNVVNLMRVLLLAAFLNSSLRYTTANLLAAMGEIKYNMIISGIGIAIQILFDIIFIPIWGVMAVAISNCIVYGTMAIVLFGVFYNKYYR